MTNEVVQAVSVSLNEEFGDDYENHMEEIKQGLKEPCFFIQCLQPTTEQFLGNRYEKITPICIQYFPQSKSGKEVECNAVAERMIWCLEYITMDGKKFRGTKMKHQVVDGVLNFFVNYDFFVYRVSDSTPMDDMEAKIKVKDGETDG